jgi:hypothetical protein
MSVGDSIVVVPVHVLALCVNDANRSALHGPRHDFSSFPTWDGGRLVGEAYLSASVGELPLTTQSPGVHVHWQLPDALRRGAYDQATGRTTFPQVPDRWLVTRSEAGEGTPSPRNWVLESNQWVLEDAEQGSPTMPYRDPDGNQYFRYLGRLFDYDAWSDSGCANELRAVGYGEVSFASYYPSCRNVFGFFDDLRASPAHEAPDLSGVRRLSYRVLGWYSRATADPLQPGPVSGKGNNLGWSFTGAASTTVCSGSLTGLTWDPAAPAAPASTSLSVAIGNTNAEALSALVASDPQLSGDKDAEFLLNAVQGGLLDKLGGDPDRSAELSFALHQQSFAHQPGGSVWTLKPRGRAQSAVPPELARSLSALNAAQRDYDERSQALPGAARQLYLDWYRLMILDELEEHPQPDSPASAFAPNLTSSALEAFVSDEATALERARTQAGLLAYRRTAGGDIPVRAEAPDSDAADSAARVCAAHAQLLAQPAIGGYVVRRVPAPRFWTPQDPVLLLSGKELGRSARRGSRRSGADLPCRLASELNDTLAYAGGPTLDAADLAAGQSYSRLPAAIAPVALSLLAETLLGDAEHAQAIAAALTAKDPALSTAAALADLAALREAMLEHGSTTAGPLSTNGLVAAPIGRTAWEGQPWEPVYLRWTLIYRPVAGCPPHPTQWTYDPSLVVEEHVLDRASVDLEIKPSVPVPPATEVPYSGTTPLASNAVTVLAEEIGRALERHPEPELADIAKHLPAHATLSQTTGGLHRGLLGEDARIQIEVFDPTRTDPLTERVHRLVGTANDAAPDGISTYSPIRSGFVELGALSLVDVFGQARAIEPHRTAWAASLHTTDSRVVLPPRLAQPARLRFAWIDPAGGEVEPAPAPQASPICGWVIPDLLDGGLTLFAADGRALGALTLVDGGTGVRWLAAPQAGGPVAPPAGEQTRADLHAIEDPVLAAFALAILLEGAAYLRSLLQVTDIAGRTVLPPAAPQYAGAALLMGRPLALARCSAGLELPGGAPAADASWELLQADVLGDAEDGRKGRRSSRLVERVRFPLRLGDLAHSDDGLVGYFRIDGDERGFATIFSPAARPGMAGVRSSDDEPLELSIAHGPATLALLFDPAAKVHATSGILPVATLSVPQDQYAAGLGRLAAYFYAGPVLAPAKGRPLQLPPVTGFHWRWRQAIGSTWTEQAWTGAASDRAVIGYGPVRLDEGWVVLAPGPPPTKANEEEKQ